MMHDARCHRNITHDANKMHGDGSGLSFLQFFPFPYSLMTIPVTVPWDLGSLSMQRIRRVYLQHLSSRTLFAYSRSAPEIEQTFTDLQGFDFLQKQR